MIGFSNEIFLKEDLIPKKGLNGALHKNNRNLYSTWTDFKINPSRTCKFILLSSLFDLLNVSFEIFQFSGWLNFSNIHSSVFDFLENLLKLSGASHFFHSCGAFSPITDSFTLPLGKPDIWIFFSWVIQHVFIGEDKAEIYNSIAQFDNWLYEFWVPFLLRANVNFKTVLWFHWYHIWFRTYVGWINFPLLSFCNKFLQKIVSWNFTLVKQLLLYYQKKHFWQ